MAPLSSLKEDSELKPALELELEPGSDSPAIQAKKEATTPTARATTPVRIRLSRRQAVLDRRVTRAARAVAMPATQAPDARKKRPEETAESEPAA